MKTQGYATGQFGKNHLGDRDEHLPTKHGFDEFFGNLYHLNAEEEPEGYFYPKDPRVQEEVRPARRAQVLAPTARSRTPARSPPSACRRSTRSSSRAAKDFIDRQAKANKPFFVLVQLHAHARLHPSQAESLGKTGKGIHADGMVEHDGMVGQLLKQLDDLSIADNTIVLYTTDNGAEIALWPDGAMTPFQGEKGTTWEGGFRIPMMVRWPGVIEPGTRYNDIISLIDWFPTLCAAAGMPDIKEKMKTGFQAGGKTFKVHLDGYNFLPYFKGEAEAGAARRRSTTSTRAAISTPSAGTTGSSASRWPRATSRRPRAKSRPGR